MRNTKKKPYGYELIIDLHKCNTSTFNRKSLDAYFAKLCKAIKMQKCERYFWDDVGLPEEQKQTSPHTKGSSAVQFILTSSIVIHTLELLEVAYINIFSCKTYDKELALKITKEWFGAKEYNTHFIERI
jgi:S-adenosylmethionine/arginine decarboxylase-like enzyme